MIEALLPFVVTGLLYGIAAVGVALIITYLRFPDLTLLGSLMIGAVVCARLTAETNQYFGLAGGAVAGAMLGMLTGIIIAKTSVEPVLAGIIAWFSSLTVGFALTNGGQAAIPYRDDYLLNSVFEWRDVLLVGATATAVVLLVSLFLKSKLGALLLAMTADQPFRIFRHRYSGRVHILTLAGAHFLVGLAGAAFVIQSQAAHVFDHLSFLPISLGAVFGGNAFAALVVRKLDDHAGSDPRPFARTSTDSFREKLSRLARPEGASTSHAGLRLLFVVLTCLFLTLIEGAVAGNAFAKLSPALSISPAFQWVTTAFLMFVFIVAFNPKRAYDASN